MDDTTGNPDPSVQDEGTDLDPSVRQDAEAGLLQDRLLSVEEKNKQLFARAKKAEEERAAQSAARRKVEEELAVLKGMPKPSAPLVPEEIEERVDLRLSGYSKDEIDFAGTYARANNLKLAEAIKIPFVQSGIEGNRARLKAEQATPPPQAREPQQGSAPAETERKKLAREAFDKLNRASAGGSQSYA